MIQVRQESVYLPKVSHVILFVKLKCIVNVFDLTLYRVKVESGADELLKEDIVNLL